MTDTQAALYGLRHAETAFRVGRDALGYKLVGASLERLGECYEN